MIVLAADLDRTLIYSTAAVELAEPNAQAVELLPVEFLDGVAVSFLTATAGKLLADLPIVPVTTRSLEQYARVQLPGPPPKFAVAGNGGHLLLDGRPDPAWAARLAQRLQTAAPLPEAVTALGRIGPPGWRRREVDGLFCYAVLDQPDDGDDYQGQLRDWAEPNGWLTSRQGRKLYLVPGPLTKSAAVAEIKARTNAREVYAAGDSRLDIDLLEYADHGIQPGHGELARSGWSAPHVHRLTETGPIAGERIAEWFAAASAGTARASGQGRTTSAGRSRPGTLR